MSQQLVATHCMRLFIENKIEKMSNETPHQNFLDKIDTTLIGFILGLILPMVMLMLLYHFNHRYGYKDWNDYVFALTNDKTFSQLPTLIWNCVFLNLPFFMLFNLIKKFNLCIGIFIASTLYIAAMLVIKFVL